MCFKEEEKINDYDGANYKQFINLEWQFMTIYRYNKHLRRKNYSTLVIDSIVVRFPKNLWKYEILLFWEI